MKNQTVCWVECDFTAISFHLAARQSICLGRLTYYSKWNEPAVILVLIKSQAQSKTEDDLRAICHAPHLCHFSLP